jgi:hypothetical protein
LGRQFVGIRKCEQQSSPELAIVARNEQMDKLMYHHEVDQIWRQLHDGPVEGNRAIPSSHPPPRTEVTNCHQWSSYSNSAGPRANAFNEPMLAPQAIPVDERRRTCLIIDCPSQLQPTSPELYRSILIIDKKQSIVSSEIGEPLATDDLLGRMFSGQFDSISHGFGQPQSSATEYLGDIVSLRGSRDCDHNRSVR